MLRGKRENEGVGKRIPRALVCRGCGAAVETDVASGTSVVCGTCGTRLQVPNYLQHDHDPRENRERVSPKRPINELRSEERVDAPGHRGAFVEKPANGPPQTSTTPRVETPREPNKGRKEPQ